MCIRDRLEILSLGPMKESVKLSIALERLRPRILVNIKKINPKNASKRYLIVFIIIIGLLYHIFSTNFLVFNINRRINCLSL